MRDGNKITPYAAKVFEWKDPKTIAFTLHDYLTWNNGFGPVTAEDVKFSFERIKGSDSAWAYQFEKLDSVEVIDQRSGLIHLKEPFKPFVYISLPYYGGHIVCKAAVEKAFNVTVEEVNTTMAHGRRRRNKFGKPAGEAPVYKKAMVKVAPGQTIEFFEGV